MKEVRKAKIVYNETTDAFEVQINTGDGWGVETIYKCVAREPGGGTNFISWRILRKLDQLQELGYQIDFGGV